MQSLVEVCRAACTVIVTGRSNIRKHLLELATRPYLPFIEVFTPLLYSPAGLDLKLAIALKLVA